MYEVVILVVKVPPPAGLFSTSTVDAKTVATRITIRPAFPYSKSLISMSRLPGYVRSSFKLVVLMGVENGSF